MGKFTNLECSGKRILIVDDEPELLSIIKFILLRCESLPILAKDVLLAQEIVLAGGIDLVICDMNMPDMTGLDFLEWLKANSPVPFVLMTGSNEIEKYGDPKMLGISGILTKPFVKKDLIEQVAACFCGLDARKAG